MDGIVLGIDPGLAITGFGVVSVKGSDITCVDYGCIRTASTENFPDRLAQIYEDMNTLLDTYKPEYVSIEQLFFYNNAKTAFKVGQARGVLLLAAINRKIPLYEFTPLQIKQAVTGQGNADKKQMQTMVQMLLNLPEIPKPDDAADALGIALCGVFSYRLNNI